MQPDNAAPQKRIVIVLGSHRSGTSLLAAGLESLGANLGSIKISASNENPKGFFENEDILNFNDRFLNFLGGRWDNPLFDGRKAIDSKTDKDLLPWLDEGTKIIISNFDSQPFVAIKDPRICQLLPFWQQLLSRCGYDKEKIHYIHIARHPMEVAKSQFKRRQANPSFYCLGDNLFETVSLWFSLSYQALRDIDSDKNILVLYDELLYHPRHQLDRLRKFLGIECAVDKIDHFCTLFVDETLKRNMAGPLEDSMLTEKFPEALEFYKEQKLLESKRLFSNADTKKALSILNKPGARVNQLEPMITLLSRVSNERYDLAQKITQIEQKKEQEKKSLEGELKEIQVKCTKLMEEVDCIRLNYEDELRKVQTEHDLVRESLQSDISSYVEALDNIRNTLSWRITSPLRWVRSAQINTFDALKTVWLRIRFRARKLNLHLKKNSPFLSNIAYRLLKPLFNILDKNLKYSGYQMYEMENFGGTLLKSGQRFEYQQPNIAIKDMPLVSIIVPNYNHAVYLRRRLESIYNQTYKNFEVILLDDCSEDDSRMILDEYKENYPETTKTLYNEENSGGVFYQWEKGLSLASGEIVWIAESDDWCSSNFLEELVEFFKDEAVMLAYCRTVFMDELGQNQIWSIEQYLSDIDSMLWKNSFVKPAHKIVRSAWAIKNIVPNVSSALFRKPVDGELIRTKEWKSMRICGDWLFYLHLIRGGLVAYSSNTTNYYRIHDKNTSIATYSTDSYYSEHEIVAKCVNRLYDVSENVFKKQREIIKNHWIQTRPGFTEEDLTNCYNIERIKLAKKERKPNLLMASYAFAAGGGETFPIKLANFMKGLGYGITFLTCEQEPREKDVREMLRCDIPVISNFLLIDKIVNEFGIDIIHSHHAWVDNTIIDILPEKSSCRLVISLHGMYEMIPGQERKWILPRLNKRVSKIVYTADKNLLSFEKYEPFENKKFVKIGNALEITHITPVDLSELGIAEDAFILCLVSRAIKEKGWKEAIESVKLAREISERDIHLLLIGEGEVYDYLIKNGYPEYVHLLGFRKNIRDYYAASDMGFLPSRFIGESFPLTVIDCLFSGKPVLASNVGEIPVMLEVEGKHAGCVFTLDNWRIPVREVARNISKCAMNTEYYNELKKLVPKAAVKFDISKMCKKYDAVYNGIIRNDKNNPVVGKTVEN